MRITWRAAGLMLAAAGAALGSQTNPPSKAKTEPQAKVEPAKKSQKKKGKKDRPPFYEKYLSGNPLDESIREAAHRVAENPGSAGLRNDLGNLLARRGFAKEALAEYSRAADLDHEFYLADYNAGLLYEKEGKDERAIIALRRSIRRKPGFPPSRFHLGLLYERRGEERAAVEQYAKALRIDDSLRLPSRNPLVVQTRLLYRVSLENYRRDLAAATLAVEAKYAQPELFRKVALDRPVDAEEVTPPDEEAELAPVSPVNWVPSASSAPSIGAKPAQAGPPPAKPTMRPVPQRPAAVNPTAAKNVSPRPGGNTLPVFPGGTFIPPAATPPPPPPPPPPPAEPPPPEEDQDVVPPPGG